MPPQPPRYPTAATESAAQRQGLTLAVILAVRALWKQLTGNWEDSWYTNVGPRVAAVVAAGQVAAAREADTYMAAVLDEVGLEVGRSTLQTEAFAGAAPSGDPLDTWLYGGVVRAAETFNRLRTAPDAVTLRTPPPGAAQQALDAGQQWMDQIVSTIMADAARAAESVAIAERPWVDGYVRMLNPPSCSRCALLAGRFYLWNDGFDRHPGCDCRHIPAAEEGDRFGSMLTNPNLYFDILPTAAELDKRHPDMTVKMRREAGLYSQEDIFTRAGSKALRDGADVSQVVNARSGMRKAQLYGRDVVITTAGTTRRGTFGGLEAQRGGSFTSRSVGRRGANKNYVERRAQRARLMPESIYQIATDREDAVRLLKVYGYIT